MNLPEFAQDIQALGQRLRRKSGAEDLAHLRKIEGWGRRATALGYATAWMGPNLVSMAALSTGRFARWTMVAHHVGHNGYERAGGPAGSTFAEGGRRLTDWMDWLVPAAWKYEHNQLHHARLNEHRDPDLVEANLSWLRESELPLPVKYALVGFFACSWKWFYYAPNTLAELHRQDVDEPQDRNAWSWSPRTEAGRALWTRSILPYAALHFVVVPALYAPLGPLAVTSALLNSVGAEILTNLHTFLIITPNHAGDDLYRFEAPPADHADYLLRQVLGSANYRTGGDLNDFLHGFLNYQIEHHLWPDLSMRAYQEAQPEVQRLCEEHGIPYVQQSVFERAWKTVQVMVGQETMPIWPQEDPCPEPESPATPRT
jgi:fatty acid desaturase